MDKVLFLATSAAKEIMQAQTVHANNLANAGTQGFKADLAQARAMQVYGPGHASRVYTGTETPATDFSPGGLDQTGRNLDVAIEGEGWFAVVREDGSEAYTRGGSLLVDAIGRLRTANGELVLGEGGPIALPPFEQVLIGNDGTVTVQPQGQAPNNLAQVERLRLVNPSAELMVKAPDGLFERADGLPAVAAEGVSVVSGVVENSNVNAVHEMTRILALAREFEIQLRLMQSAEENDQAATSLISIN